MPDEVSLVRSDPEGDCLLDGAVFFVSLLLFVAFAVLVYRVYPHQQIIPEMFSSWNAKVLAPEPAERFVYAFGLAYFLLVPALLRVSVERFFPDAKRAFFAAYEKAPGRFWTMCYSGAAIWLLLVSGRTLLKYHISPAVMVGFAGAAAASMFVSGRPSEIRGLKSALIAVSVVFAALGASLLVVNESVLAASPAVSDSFYVLLGTLNQVFHGRTVLVDLPSQYGVLFPYLGAAVVSVFGASVATVSAYFVAIILLTFLFLMWAVYRKMGVTPLAAVSFFALLGLAHPFFYASTLGIDPYSMAPYYAYLPVRVVFGAFFLAFSHVFLETPSIRNYILGSAAAAAAVLWNADTGLVLALSWFALLCYRTASSAKSVGAATLDILRHAAVIVSALAVAAFCYAAYAKYRSGHYPDWALSARYQALFYKSGFMMLRMKLLELWHLPLMVYAITLYSCVRRLISRNASATDAWYFYIAVYGLGIFSYYQGRSHLFCLTAVVYPAALLMAFYAYDMLYGKPAPACAFRFPRVKMLFLVLPLAISLAVLPKTFSRLFKLSGGGGNGILTVEFSDQIKFLREKGPEGVLVLSDNADLLYFLAGVASPAPYGSLAEVILREDVQKLQDTVDSGAIKHILVGKMAAPLTASLNLVRYRKVSAMKDFTLYSLGAGAVKRGGGGG
jgi:hypothetical protein